MLKVISFILILFISLNTYTQTRYGRTLDNNLVQSTISQSDILYLGIDNKLKISDSLVKSYDTLNLSTNNGIIIHDNNYILIPLRTGTLRLIINGFQNNKKYLVGHRNFFVKQVPEPKIKLNSIILKDINTIQRTIFLAADSLSVYVSEDIVNSENWYKVTEFSIGYTYGGHFISCSNIGNKFSTKTIEFISKVERNHELMLNAIIESESSVVIILPVIKIFLTD